MVRGVGGRICFFVDANGNMQQQAYESVRIVIPSYRPFQAVPFVGMPEELLVPPTIAKVFFEQIQHLPGVKTFILQPYFLADVWYGIYKGEIPRFFITNQGFSSVRKVMDLFNSSQLIKFGFLFLAEGLTKKNLIVITKEIIIPLGIVIGYSWMLINQTNSLCKELKDLHENYNEISSEKVILTGMKIARAVCFILVGGVGLTGLSIGAMHSELIILSLLTISHLITVSGIFYNKIVVAPEEHRREAALLAGRRADNVA